MGASRLVWLEKEQFVGFDGAGHPVVVSSETPENGFGAKPSDLMLIALASCTAVDIVRILAKKRQAMDRLEIAVEGEQDADPPWRFTRIHLTYRARGRSLQEEAVRRAVELAEGLDQALLAFGQGEMHLVVFQKDRVVGQAHIRKTGPQIVGKMPEP